MDLSLVIEWKNGLCAITVQTNLLQNRKMQATPLIANKKKGFKVNVMQDNTTIRKTDINDEYDGA